MCVGRSCHTSVTGHPCDLPAGQGVASLRELRCSDCGSYVRPDVVLFGESLPADEWRAAVEACRNLSSRDCMLVVGTSGGVYPAAGLPEAVLAAGVPLIEVNKDPSPISRAAQCFLQGTAAEVLPRLVAAVLAS
jgi:NAD-dependent deacetylase